MRRKSGSVSERSNESSETGLKFASFTREIEILMPSSFKNMIVDPMLPCVAHFSSVSGWPSWSYLEQNVRRVASLNLGVS